MLDCFVVLTKKSCNLIPLPVIVIPSLVFRYPCMAGWFLGKCQDVFTRKCAASLTGQKKQPLSHYVVEVLFIYLEIKHGYFFHLFIHCKRIYLEMNLTLLAKLYTVPVKSKEFKFKTQYFFRNLTQ